MRRWHASEAVRAEVLVVHGYGEHGGRYRELAHVLAAGGFGCTALDYRGHGKASGPRGHVARYDEYHADLDAALAWLPRGRPTFVLGHSHGGLLVLDWLRARRPTLHGLVLTNPYLDLALPVPALKLAAGRVLARWWPSLSMPSDLPPEGMSHDPSVIESYRRDPLCHKRVTPGWFAEVQAAQRRVCAMTAVDMPLLYVYSDADPICSPRANHELAERLSAPHKDVWVRAGEFHEVLNELDRAALHGQVRDWLRARLDA